MVPSQAQLGCQAIDEVLIARVVSHGWISTHLFLGGDEEHHPRIVAGHREDAACLRAASPGLDPAIHPGIHRVLRVRSVFPKPKAPGEWRKSPYQRPSSWTLTTLEGLQKRLCVREKQRPAPATAENNEAKVVPQREGNKGAGLSNRKVWGKEYATANVYTCPWQALPTPP